MKKLYYMMLLALVSLTMTSCHDWDSPYYVEDIVGSWVSYYGQDGYGTYDIVGYDVVRYDFYSNYTGRYTYYGYYGLDYYDFYWDTHGDRLIIHYDDGTSEYLYYGFDRNGDLLMATDSRFYNFTAYRPAGMYYEPGKALPSIEDKSVVGKGMDQVEKVGKAEAAKSTSRACKSRADVSK